MSSHTPLRVGLLVGRERSFPDALIAEVNARDEGIRCEYVLLDGTRMDATPPYTVLVDRISHKIPYYAAFLKAAALAGAVVINSPFWSAADDKFFGAALVTRLGLASPRTVALPNQRYRDGIVSASLRNLVYPVDWQGIVDHTGLPAVLRPHWGDDWKDTTVVHSLEQLWAAYNRSGTRSMIVQEYIGWEHCVRCICVGQERVLPIHYNPYAPPHERYLVDHPHLEPDLIGRVQRDARLINRAMGYDISMVEFAVRDGVPYVVDLLSNAPDFDRASLPPVYFEWVVKSMADLVITRAWAAGPPPEPHWRALMRTRPPAW